MGAILSSRMQEHNKVIFEVIVDYNEAIQLYGRMDNIHIFSEDSSGIKTNISQRGKNEATKYFLIPKELRKDLKLNAKTTCQKIETKTKTVFIYVLDKIGV